MVIGSPYGNTVLAITSACLALMEIHCCAWITFLDGSLISLGCIKWTPLIWGLWWNRCFVKGINYTSEGYDVLLKFNCHWCRRKQSGRWWWTLSCSAADGPNNCFSVINIMEKRCSKNNVNGSSFLMCLKLSSKSMKSLERLLSKLHQAHRPYVNTWHGHAAFTVNPDMCWQISCLNKVKSPANGLVNLIKIRAVIYQLWEVYHNCDYSLLLSEPLKSE